MRPKSGDIDQSSTGCTIQRVRAVWVRARGHIDYTGYARAGFDWIGLGWIGLDWIGLDSSPFTLPLNSRELYARQPSQQAVIMAVCPVPLRGIPRCQLGSLQRSFILFVCLSVYGPRSHSSTAQVHEQEIAE